MSRIHAFLLLVLQVCSVRTSHFRGSMISWRVVNASSNPLVVEILQRHAWNFTWWPCTNAHIAAGNYMIGSGNLVCAAPCPFNATNLGSVAVPCTGFNHIERYVSGEGRLRINVPANRTFRAVFNSTAWFGLVTGGGPWSVATEINTFRRPNGRFNQAPIVTMLPVIRLRRLVSYQIKINVADNDFDRYRCTWSNSSQECGGVCRSALSLPAGTFLNDTSCVLHFRPVNVGFYAMAFTVMDYENATSTAPLSRVPIQLIFNVWTTNITCAVPPQYIGDAPADECLFIEPGQSITVLIRIRVQCPNASLANIITVNPAGFRQSPTYLDPYDPTINVFMVNYTANSDQVGQNLFCFAGVDSIGNQGDSSCIRFTVQSKFESQNSIYVRNSTRFPTGLVLKNHSVWTLMYPPEMTFVRPDVNAFIRFKLRSTEEDFVAYNVLTQPDRVEYQFDRLIIRSNVIFRPGEQFFISFDPGVFLPIATCFRDSMGIGDSNFWPFETPFEPNTTITTTTTTTAMTTTLRNRTVPTVRTITTRAPTTTVTQTTLLFTTVTQTLTTQKPFNPRTEFPIGGSVGITIGGLILICAGFSLAVICLRRPRKKDEPLEIATTESTPSEPEQYRVTTRRAAQPFSRVDNSDPRDGAKLINQVQKSLITVKV